MAAGFGGDEFRFGSWVFSAVKRSEVVMPANSLVFFIKIEPWTDIGQLAAGPAAVALARRFLATGNMLVSVLLSFAAQVLR